MLQLIKNIIADVRFFWVMFILFIFNLSNLRDFFSKEYCPTEVMIAHDGPITLLPPDVNCTVKSSGVTSGEICKFENKTFFLKVIPCDFLSDGSQIMNYDIYNGVFLSNINITVPRQRIFRKKNFFYIGSEKVPGLTFFNKTDSHQKYVKELTEKGLAELMVAATFIRDLQLENWGYNEDGLVLIDLDSLTNYRQPMGMTGLSYTYPIPTTIKDYLKLSVESLNYLPIALSLNIVQEMQRIYQKMLHVPLPKFHEHFKQNHQTYLDLLKTCIEICNRALVKVKTLNPEIGATELTLVVNQVLLDELISVYCKDENFYDCSKALKNARP